MSAYSIQSRECSINVNDHEVDLADIYCKHGSRRDVGEFACLHIMAQVNSLEFVHEMRGRSILSVFVVAFEDVM